MVEKSFLEFFCAFSSVGLVWWPCRHEDEEVSSLSADTG